MKEGFFGIAGKPFPFKAKKLTKHIRLLTALFYLLTIASCTDKALEEHPLADERLFTILNSESTGVDFKNQLTLTPEINPYTYRNFFNGGGVGLGDFNQDGLLDVFLTGNLVDNKLYYNRGNLQFEDVTSTAGVACNDSWSTGVAVVDINADGWLDIYVCKSGPPAAAGLKQLNGTRHNELFINQQDGTFLESAAAYGLDLTGLAVHTAFFDYDLDGDLDCYLLNNSNRSTTGYDLKAGLRDIPDEAGGNKLLRCDQQTDPTTGVTTFHYTEVTAEAGIYASAIGFGLGVTVGDVNQDGWPDLFVSNDFFERDYLYYNQGDGTFKEALTSHLPEISLGSMGADMADLTNDGLPELFVTEMLPATDVRYKSKATFQGWNRYQLYRDQGYHQQFSRNVLQLNRGGGHFSEIARLSGVAATDWSWGALLFDANADGRKDIFVANGNGRDLLDQDYINFDGNPAAIRRLLFDEGKSIVELIEKIPQEKLINGIYRNDGNLAFQEVAKEWGLDVPSFSNGSAYGDLDNDGDLDLVVNNIDDRAFICRNNYNKALVTLNLQMPGTANPFAIGTRVYAHLDESLRYEEVQPMRGFQSTVDTRLSIALGDASQIDSLLIYWPNGQLSIHRNLAAGAHKIVIPPADEATATAPVIAKSTNQLLQPVAIQGLAKHEESNFIDFNQDALLFWSVSNEGPALATTDLDGNGLMDVYLGGAAGTKGQLALQVRPGQFRQIAPDVWAEFAGSEDTDACFFDADGDGDQDLYICAGGYEFARASGALLDRLYLNEGNNRWVKSPQLLPSASRPVSSSCVRPADYDGDGDLDLFVGGRLVPRSYGLPATSYLLENDGSGTFSVNALPEMKDLGMVTDARWVEKPNQEGMELVVCGEFMPLTIFDFSVDGSLEGSRQIRGSAGLWYSIAVTDLDGDGDQDIVAGNHGLNSRLQASEEAPLQMIINDFDRNGKMEQILCFAQDGESIPWVLKDDLSKQLPILQKELLRYADYAGKSLSEIFPAEVLERSVVLSVQTLATTAYYRQPNGQYRAENLVAEAQLSPTYALTVGDVNQDGIKDILLGGNQRIAKPELGIYAAGFGQLLLGNEAGGFSSLTPLESGVLMAGEVRNICEFGPGKWLVARSNDECILLETK